MIRSFIIAGILAVTQVHMHDRPDLNNWFENLHNSDKGLCCSGSEGTVLAIDEIRTTDVEQCEQGISGDVPAHYCVRLEGRWFQVPDTSVVTVPNKYGQALVWPVWYGDGSNLHKRVFVRCFLPGSLT